MYFRVSTFGILELYQFTPAPSSSRNFTALGSQVLLERLTAASCVTGKLSPTTERPPKTSDVAIETGHHHGGQQQ